MAGYSINPIDLDRLETQLHHAIEEDEKYKREDAAKFRAIEQSKTYEEFRNIVKASHLKPLDKHESLSTKNMRPMVWNTYATCTKNSPKNEQVTSSFTHSSQRVKIDELMQKQLSYYNFQQLWLLLCEDQERRVIMLKKAISQGNIFQNHDIPVDLMVEVMETLNDSLSDSFQIPEETFELAIETMRSIFSTPRFTLHVMFLNERERNVISQLKEKVKAYLKEKEKQNESGGSEDTCVKFLDNF
ncbi:coiled-coil domain-containing protein 103 [Ischnura elegans]|uniref:coiled-coil domain-containing protein 103 n=1 Tax=Ischnura elegans TaxID=197161 RepID=UPI001ED86D5A|nr:coiled-coil domain-containing protein 103 [Ischnura elegans]